VTEQFSRLLVVLAPALVILDTLDAVGGDFVVGAAKIRPGAESRRVGETMGTAGEDDD
jgi:hypothetical protein